MERLNCYMCQQLVSGGLNGLVRHLISIHGLTINRGVGNAGFKCGQNGCQRTFIHLYTLRRHIRNYHLHERNTEPEQERERGPAVVINQLYNNEMNNEICVQFNDTEDSENTHDNLVYSDNDSNDNNNDKDFDLQKFVIRMIAKFQCNGSMTGHLLTQILDECEELLLTVRDFMKKKVRKIFEDNNMLHDDVSKDVLQVLEFDSPFEQMRTLDEQINALKKHCGYIEPIEIPLGYRLDNKLDSETATYIPKMIMETCQYIPIIDSLKLVLSNEDVRQAILSERKSIDDNILASFLDGQHATIHPFLLQHKHALRIQLYYDELEIVNPLGSKTGVHKLGAFYYTIQNLPPHINSELSSIHVLLLCCDSDVKKYGFKKILAPFVQDLVKLESDEGIPIEIGPHQFILRGFLAAFVGDGLSVHDVYNLLGPSANKFCRMCLYTRADLHAGSVESAQPRTEEVFNEHLALLEQTNFSAESKSATGVQGDCSLHSSRYFHISRNKIFDPMHDFLCGICPMILKLILREYILVQGRFNVQYFNDRISSFQYGFTEKVNKPSANFTEAMLRKRDNTLSQKAMQTWCLVRAFPFLVCEKVRNGDEHMEMILILLQIMELVFSPKITKSLIPYLRTLITNFIQVFKKLFPEINLINKFHHLSHYPECILWSGPLVHYSCMRYEAKHNEIKKRAHNVCNFKNPPKTLVRIFQCSQSARWGGGEVKLIKLNSSNSKTVLIQNIENNEDFYALGYHDDDEVLSYKFVRWNGIEFRKKLFVCLEVAHIREDNLLLFGYIKEIFVLHTNRVCLNTSICTTTQFDTDLNAYQIELPGPGAVHRLVEISILAHFKPLACWTKSTSNNLFISLCHIII